VPPTPPPSGESRRIGERSAEQVRALILKIHERLKLDHFEVLGLERSASETEVREAYAGFARILHPDAVLDPALADLSEMREAVFIRLSTAHETLRNPASRASYERAFEPSKLRFGRPAPARPEPPAPPPSPSPAPAPVPAATPRVPALEPDRPTFDERLTPEGILATAECLYKDAAYWEAIQQLEPMIRRATGATRARARLLLAQAYLKNPKWTRRAEAVLQDLLAEDPRHVAAHLRLAEIYRATGLASRARSAFEKVLELEPGHIQARKALEALQPKEQNPASGLATLLRRR
jgi:tetratricopeptide (TPR) repeat protein